MSRIDIVKTEVFKFNELSDNGKENAIEGLCDINVDYEWWESVYEDAEQIGIKITGFDIGRSAYCSGELQLSAHEVAANIILEHGGHCETNKTAQAFLDGVNSIEVTEGEEVADTDDDEEYEGKMMELEDGFTKSVLEDYRIMLRKSYNYFTSEEAIVETIEANDYEFTADGSMY